MTPFLEPTQESGRALFARRISGKVVMLNLLRFREVADYTATPELAPKTPISGAAAYRRYLEFTLPHLEKSGGEVTFLAKGGQFLIGPTDERWDAAMLVRSYQAFGANIGLCRTRRARRPIVFARFAMRFESGSSIYSEQKVGSDFRRELPRSRSYKGLHAARRSAVRFRR